MKLSFRFARMPHLIFGPGRFQELPALIKRFGNNALIVTGSQSLRASGILEILTTRLADERIRYGHVVITGEPSPEDVDDAVGRFRDKEIRVVVAVGGGSALDAGKAISAMLPLGESVMHYLEKVGTGAVHPGVKIPLVAVPTTAGTGSEATKNAVLSRVGPEGFKSSLRHDNFVPDAALIDPSLTISCPPSITAACGMDAITQLIESYVSVEASPLTDSLALHAFGLAAEALVPACTTHPRDVSVRAKLSYASFVSGATLANAGLGVVHGIAGVLGGYAKVPHGVVCGTLVAEATRVNIAKLEQTGDSLSLKKYADLGAFFTESRDPETRINALMATMSRWTDELRLPRLREFGVTATLLERVARESGTKHSPVRLSSEEIRDILLARL